MLQRIVAINGFAPETCRDSAEPLHCTMLNL